MNRRKWMLLIGTGISAAAAGGLARSLSDGRGLVPDIRTREKPINEPRQGEPGLYRSTLTLKDIQSDKNEAITTLQKAILAHNEKDERGIGKLNHIVRNAFPVLPHESQMDIPSNVDYQRFRDLEQRDATFRANLHDLMRNIQPQRYGFFVDGDMKAIYVLQNVGTNQFRLVKKYKLLPSKDGWSNVLGSGGTPTGLHGFARRSDGLLCEDVSQEKKHAGNFIPRAIRNKVRYFTRDVRKADGDGYPAMTTRAFLMVAYEGAAMNPGTTSARGANLHGRNYLEDLVAGTNGTSGCLGMANVDIEDINQYIDMGEPVIVTKKGSDGELYDEYVRVKGGTPIMIHATGGIRKKVPVSPETHREEPRNLPLLRAPKQEQGPNWSPFTDKGRY